MAPRSMHPLRHLLRYSKPYQNQIGGAIACSILNTIFDLAPPYLIGIAIDVVVNEENSLIARLGVTGIPSQLAVLSLLTFAIWSLESLSEYGYSRLWRNLAQTLPQFERYRQPTQHIRELLVCTHGNVDVACSRFGYPLYQQLRRDYAGDKLRVWRCSHFGGHNFAPTLIDLPTGQYWDHLESEILDSLIHRRREVAKLRRFYRGWSGLAHFEQMVEPDLWMQHGWDWLSYRKAGQTLAIDSNKADEEDADWAEVRIEFEAPESREAGAYEARVEVRGEVMTQWRSRQQPRTSGIAQKV